LIKGLKLFDEPHIVLDPVVLDDEKSYAASIEFVIINKIGQLNGNKKTKELSI